MGSPVARASVLLLAGVLYIAACASPAMGVGDNYKRGVDGLVWGWYTLSWEYPMWLANPVALAASLLLAGNLTRAAVATGLVALGLGIAYLVKPYYPPLYGAYLWVGSMAVLFLGTVAAWRSQAIWPVKTNDG